MYDFFISYSRDDEDKIKELIEVLDEKGIDYFIDTKKINYGVSHTKKLQNSILNAKKVLLIWTKQSDSSPWVQREINFSLENQIPVIPIRLGEFKSEGFDFLFSNINWCPVVRITKQNSEEIIARSIESDENNANNDKIVRKGRISARSYKKSINIKKKEFDVDVFLVCDETQVPLAKKLARRFKSRGIKTFIDKNGSKENKEQSLKIGKILNSASTLLILWDKNIEQYPMLNFELNYARGLGKNMVAYKFAGFESDLELESLLETAKVFSGEGIDKKILLKLVNYIDRLIPTEEKKADLEKQMQEAFTTTNRNSEDKKDEEFFNVEEVNDISTLELDMENSQDEGDVDFLEADNEFEEADQEIDDDDDEPYELESLKKFQDVLMALLGLPPAIIKDLANVIKTVAGIRDRKKKRKRIKKSHIKSLKKKRK